MENNLERGFDEITIDGRSFDDLDSELFPLQIDVDDGTEACFDFYSNWNCDALDQSSCLYWSYPGGPGFSVQIEETSTTAIEKPRTFGCDLPEVLFKIIIFIRRFIRIA